MSSPENTSKPQGEKGPESSFKFRIDWAKILPILISGLLGSGLTFVSTWQQNSNDRISMILERYDKDNGNLRTRVAELETTIAVQGDQIYEMRTERSELLQKFQILEAGQIKMPVPFWIKSLDGKMLMINDAYVDAFIRPRGDTRDDYVGKTDIEYWGKKVGSIYQHNDQKALRALEPIVFRETVPIAGKDIGEDWLFMKYKLLVNGQLVGIAGIGFPVSIITDN